MPLSSQHITVCRSRTSLPPWHFTSFPLRMYIPTLALNVTMLAPLRSRHRHWRGGVKRTECIRSYWSAVERWVCPPEETLLRRTSNGERGASIGTSYRVLVVTPMIERREYAPFSTVSTSHLLLPFSLQSGFILLSHQQPYSCALAIPCLPPSFDFEAYRTYFAYCCVHSRLTWIALTEVGKG